MNPRICLLIIAYVIAAIAPLQAATLELPTATQFTIRRAGANPGEIDSDPFGFFGFIQGSPTSWYIDETFFEFDASALAGVANASLTFTVRSSAPGNDLLIARTFDISHYAGSGIPDLARFGSGQYIETLAVEAQASYYQSRIKTLSLDVTALLAAAVANNQSHIGFRLHHPVDVTPGSDSVPNVSYQYDSARLSVVVPEPSSQVLLIGCALGHLAAAGNRRMGRCRDV
jgi:hypothetical protein